MFDRYRLLPLMLLIPLQAGIAYGVTIRFRSRVEASQPFIHLGDIAEITGATPEIIAAYERAKLARVRLKEAGRCWISMRFAIA